MVDRDPEPLFALRVLSGPMVGTEVPLEGESYVIVAGPRHPPACDAPDAAPGAAGERTLWLTSEQDAVLRLDLGDTALSGRFSITDIADGSHSTAELQRSVSFAALRFAVKPLDAPWADEALRAPVTPPDGPPAADRAMPGATDAVHAPTDAGTKRPTVGQRPASPLGAPHAPHAPHAPRGLYTRLRRRLLSVAALVCMAGLIAAGAARALPGTLGERRGLAGPLAGVASRAVPVPAGAVPAAPEPSQPLPPFEARRLVEKAAAQAGVKPVAVRSSSDAWRVVLLDEDVPPAARATVEARFTAALARLAPTLPSADIEYVQTHAVLAAARALFAQAGVAHREQRLGGSTRLSPTKPVDDATRQALREPLRAFRTRWGDRLVRIDFEPSRDARDGRSHLDGRAGYVLLAPGHWYFPDLLKG